MSSTVTRTVRTQWSCDRCRTVVDQDGEGKMPSGWESFTFQPLTEADPFEFCAACAKSLKEWFEREGAKFPEPANAGRRKRL